MSSVFFPIADQVGRAYNTFVKGRLYDAAKRTGGQPDLQKCHAK